jgi:serine/threonine protein kinase
MRIEMESRVERKGSGGTAGVGAAGRAGGRIGPFRLVRKLEAGRLGERWLAFNEQEQTPHVAHRLPLGGASESRRFIAAVEELAMLRHPHLLTIEQFSLAAAATGHGEFGWVVTPFTGSHDGLVMLAGLGRDKAAGPGRGMNPLEVERAMVQILEAVEYAHAAGHHHGPIGPEEILVDRRGSLSVELYGLRRRMAGAGSGPGLQVPPASEVARDEVRSVVEMGYWLLTGLPAEEPRIEATRLVPRLDRRWDEFFAEGLDPLAGFASAAEALGSLPGIRRELEGRENPVQVVIRGVRRALTK